ncbi:MAG: hypothetical protein AAB646_02505 [Patescibacteria group bacterium]
MLAKPLQREAFDESVIYEMEKQDRLVITRKRNGYKIFAVKYRNRVKIYTDGMNEATNRLEHIAKELELKMAHNKSMIVGEAVIDLNDNDDYLKVASIFKSNPKRAIDLQKIMGKIRMMIFDVVFWSGANTLNHPYVSPARLGLIQRRLNGKYAFPVPVLDMSYDEAKKLVAEKKKTNEHGWEGLVLYDKDFKSSFRLDGKSPERIKGCYKWKPILEDDFIIRSWIPSEKNLNLVKEVVLLQVDPVTGREFSCGKFGGFTKKMRTDLAAANYPLVMQIEFEVRFPSGKLCNARLGPMGIRADKKPENCVASVSYPNAEVILTNEENLKALEERMNKSKKLSDFVRTVRSERLNISGQTLERRPSASSFEQWADEKKQKLNLSKKENKMASEWLVLLWKVERIAFNPYDGT